MRHSPAIAGKGTSGSLEAAGILSTEADPGQDGFLGHLQRIDRFEEKDRISRL